jgi:hypothetical protein
VNQRIRTWTKEHIGILLVIAIQILILVFVNPFRNIPVNDDYGYTLIAKNFAETNRFQYNGCNSSFLGFQIIYAGMLIKALGFPYIVTRLSTIPISISCLVLFYRIILQLKLDRKIAAIGGLFLALNPIFAVSGLTFMSDNYGLLFQLLALSFGIASVHGRPKQSSLNFFLFVLAALIGGTVRQYVFILIPLWGFVLCYLNRNQLMVKIATMSCGLVVAGLAYRWFNAQPFYTPDPTPTIGPYGKGLLWMYRQSWPGYIGMILTLGCSLLPLFALTKVEKISNQRFAALGGLIAVLYFGAYRFAGTAINALYAPWMANTFTPRGFMSGGQNGRSLEDASFLGFSGVNPPLLLFAVLGVASIFATAWLSLRLWERCKTSKDRSSQNQTIQWLTLSFAVPFLLVLAPRLNVHTVFDRYLLPIYVMMVLTLFGALDFKFSRIRTSFAVVACVFPVAWTLVTFRDHLMITEQIASTKADLIQKGYSPNEVRASFELDNLQQILSVGYLNDPRISNPNINYRKYSVADMSQLSGVQESAMHGWWWEASNSVGFRAIISLKPIANWEQIPGVTPTKLKTLFAHDDLMIYTLQRVK